MLACARSPARRLFAPPCNPPLARDIFKPSSSPESGNSPLDWHMNIVSSFQSPSPPSNNAAESRFRRFARPNSDSHLRLMLATTFASMPDTPASVAASAAAKKVSDQAAWIDQPVGQLSCSTPRLASSMVYLQRL